MKFLTILFEVAYGNICSYHDREFLIYVEFSTINKYNPVIIKIDKLYYTVPDYYKKFVLRKIKINKLLK